MQAGSAANWTVTINPLGVAAPLNASVQRAIDLAAFGLHATDSAADPGPTFHGALNLPGVVIQIGAVVSNQLDFEGARAEFRRWVIAAALRQCVEAVDPALEQLRAVAVLAGHTGTMSAEQWNDEIVADARRFDRRHLPDKLSHLRELGGESVLPALTPVIESINLARNCLVHRAGIVQQRDVNTPEGDGLRVSWTKLDLVVESQGQTQLVREVPFEVKAGDQISVRQSPSSRLFRLGDSLIFTPDELSQICYTFVLFGQQLVASAQHLLSSSGIPHKDELVASEANE